MCDDCYSTPASAIRWVILNLVTGLAGCGMIVGGWAAYVWIVTHFSKGA